MPTHYFTTTGILLLFLLWLLLLILLLLLLLLLSYFAVPKNVTKNSTHNFIMKIPNKQEF